MAFCWVRPPAPGRSSWGASDRPCVSKRPPEDLTGGGGELSGEEGRVLRLSLILATQSYVLKYAGGLSRSAFHVSCLSATQFRDRRQDVVRGGLLSRLVVVAVVEVLEALAPVRVSPSATGGSDRARFEVLPSVRGSRGTDLHGTRDRGKFHIGASIFFSRCGGRVAGLRVRDKFR